MRSTLVVLLVTLSLGVGLAEGGEPRSATIPQIDQGKSLFERNCAVCHGIGGTGGRGPALTRSRLSRAPNDASLIELIRNGIPPEMPLGNFLADDDIVALASYVRSLGKSTPEDLPGNASRGAHLFLQYGCNSCHIFAGTGTGYGPELTDLSERRGTAYVRRVILNPRLSLPADFLMVSVQTREGETVRGIRVNEDTFSIQIKDANGTFHSYNKSTLIDLQRLSGETPMPKFEGILSEDDLRDLVAYLGTPK